MKKITVGAAIQSTPTRCSPQQEQLLWYTKARSSAPPTLSNPTEALHMMIHTWEQQLPFAWEPLQRPCLARQAGKMMELPRMFSAQSGQVSHQNAGLQVIYSIDACVRYLISEGAVGHGNRL
jgi:hypothetical protein